MSSKSILSILLIEDNPGDVRLINELLIENTSLHHQLHVANSLGEGCNLLKNHEFTVILLDLNLPDSSGKDTFNTVFQDARNIPIILITGLQDVEQVLS
nr:response regulator [Paludibacter sp.]